eukprot:scaffold374_cov108-Isochrysis_galbana.AAC.1
MGLSLSPASPAPLPPVEPEATFFIYDEEEMIGKEEGEGGMTISILSEKPMNQSAERLTQDALLALAPLYADASQRTPSGR